MDKPVGMTTARGGSVDGIEALVFPAQPTALHSPRSPPAPTQAAHLRGGFEGGAMVIRDVREDGGDGATALVVAASFFAELYLRGCTGGAGGNALLFDGLVWTLVAVLQWFCWRRDGRGSFFDEFQAVLPLTQGGGGQGRGVRAEGGGKGGCNISTHSETCDLDGGCVA